MIKRLCDSIKISLVLTVFSCVYPAYSNAKEVQIDMKEVAEIVKKPVDESLEDTPIKPVSAEEYWKILHETIKDRKPLVAFFYSNRDPESQRAASLLRYVSVHYSEHIYFIRVQTTVEGKPDKDLSKKLEKQFSLDKTPGVLFYKVTEERYVLTDEDYVDADYKEFRTPSLIFWRTYYKAVCEELDRLLSD